MAWTLAGITIHPEGKGDDVVRVESHYSIQQVIDASTEDIDFFGAGSDHRALRFKLDETENSNNGLAALKAAVRADANVNLTSDQGSQGNFRILSLMADRLQALNKANPVYDCEADLIAV